MKINGWHHLIIVLTALLLMASCVNSNLTTPNVKLAYAKHRDRKFQIIGINLDSSIAPLEAYIQRERIEWRQYLDSTGKISGLYNVRAIPSTFLIDGTGIVRRVNLRGLALESAVAELVRENLGN